jgi:hypothetical protein
MSQGVGPICTTHLVTTPDCCFSQHWPTLPLTPVLFCCVPSPPPDLVHPPPAPDLQLSPVKSLVSNIGSVSCGTDFTVWLTKEGEVRQGVVVGRGPRGEGGDRGGGGVMYGTAL